MTLTLVQMRPDMLRLMRWAEREGVLPRRGGDDPGYALHALLAAAFGPHAPKPFALLRRPDRPAELLGYTASDEAAFRDHAETFAEPEVAAALGLTGGVGLATKAMPSAWTAGRRLGFSVRVRPMRRTDRDGDRTRAKEVDAFVLSRPNSNRGGVYAEWLRERLGEGGAGLETASLDGFRRTIVVRRGRVDEDGRRRARPQEGPDATFTGTLTIRDPAAFATLLARGVGRHRAFGFGMLLLRPADTSAAPC